jgi:hypothetical protein
LQVLTFPRQRVEALTAPTAHDQAQNIVHGWHRYISNVPHNFVIIIPRIWKI